MGLILNQKQYTLKCPKGLETEKFIFLVLFLRLTMDPLLKF